MKRINFYLSLMLLMVFAASCSDEFDQPPMVIPVAEHTANMTIAEFKAKHWQDAVNYIDTVKEDEIIHGWVTSTDESGNIYKALYISDGTAGLTISVNKSSLYETYRPGQEVVIPMKDCFVGKYNGQQQIGYPAYYASGNVWEATFLPFDTWQSIAEINGLPDLSQIDTTEVSIGDFQSKFDSETLLKYQGKLIRLNDVQFEAADGKTTYGLSTGSTNRNLIDDNNNTLIVRTSNYADFYSDTLPEGKIDVIGVLSFYATRANSSGTWQLYLRTASDVIGGNGKGTSVNPYTVDEAIAEQNSGASGWVRGYAVGAVAPEVTTVSSNSDIEWKAPTTLTNTLVLAPDPNCTDYKQCVVISLPQNSPFREQANLKENEEIYKTIVMAKGTLATYMGTSGITDNLGSTDEFRLSVVSGLKSMNETFENALPDNWTNFVVSGDKKWFQTTYDNNGYAAMTGYKGSNPPFDAWFISPSLNIAKAAKKTLTFRTRVAPYSNRTTTFEVYVLNTPDPTTATVKVKLDAPLAQPGSSTYSDWYESGIIDLSPWSDGCYYIGFRYYATTDANYATWCLDDVSFANATDPAEEAKTRADFETMGTPNSSYGTYTSTAGWVATNSCLLSGAAADSNPYFAFIGYKSGSNSVYAMAPTLNGKTSAPGTLVSPTIAGGMTKLRFSYGAAWTETQLSFRVDVKQNGNVVKSWTVTQTDVTKHLVYNFEEDCDINGSFVIEITNLCPSGKTTNKDRVSIWNMNWDLNE